MAVGSVRESGRPAVDLHPEWWELVRDRFAAWRHDHKTLSRRLRLLWLVVCAVGLVCLVVAAVLFPNVRAAAGAYIGVAWLLLCWFLFARTRTLSFGAFTLLYGASIVWSIAVGLICLRLTEAASKGWPVYFHNPDTIGPAVGIASVAEESLKLLPVAVLALAAPGRVRRFAAVDWLLVGLASGAAFLCVEEVQRRLSVLLTPGAATSSLSQVRCGWGTVDEQLDCNAMTRFGLNPFSTKPTNAGVLDPIFGGTDTQYAGQHVMTALVAAGVGIGIVIWRRAGRLGTVARLLHRTGAVGLPLLLLWVGIADHAVLNAEGKAGANLLTNDPYWLKPSSTVAMPIRWWYTVGGHGDGRMVLLVGLLIVALLCDASRAWREGWWALDPAGDANWAERLRARIVTRRHAAAAAGVVRLVQDAVVAVLLAGIALVYVVTRDLSVALLAHARTHGESRQTAMLRGRAVLLMQRETRELAAGSGAHPDPRSTYRSVATIAMVVLLVLALVVAPHAATSIGYDSTFPDRWLAGLFEGLARWWNSLTPTQQLLLTALLALAIAIPFGFGAGFFLAGGLTYLAAHGKGVAALLLNPRAATRDYLANRSLGGMALDAGELVLTFVPAGLGSVAKVGATGTFRGAARDYLDDPAAWRAARKALFAGGRNERGSLSLGHADGLPRINGKRPRAHALAGQVWRGEEVHGLLAWPDAVRKAYPNGVRYSLSGFPDFSPYAIREERLVGGFTGIRQEDDRLANALAGLSKKPAGYTWHHVEDGHTMQLVPRQLHEAVPHTGGHAVGKP